MTKDKNSVYQNSGVHVRAVVDDSNDDDDDTEIDTLRSNRGDMGA
jgi:hypothetical protein